MGRPRKTRSGRGEPLARVFTPDPGQAPAAWYCVQHFDALHPSAVRTVTKFLWCDRRAQLRPPGHAKPAAKKPSGQAKRERPVSERRSARDVGPLDAVAEAPTLRQSTRRRVEDAEKERTRVEQVLGCI